MTQPSLGPMPQLSPRQESQTQTTAGVSRETSTLTPTLFSQFTELWQRIGLFRDVLAVAVAGTLALIITLSHSNKSNSSDQSSPSIEQLWKAPLQVLQRMSSEN